MKKIFLSMIIFWMSSILYSTSIVGDGIIFEYDAQNAQSVFLVGSMNNWDTSATPMKKEGDGVWRIFLKLDHGDYTYKFMVDGNWEYDQNNPEYEDDGYGGYNSIIRFYDANKSSVKSSYNSIGVKSNFNPKIYFKGHYYSINKFIKNNDSRFMLSKPEHDLNFGINVKFNRDFEAYTVLNVNNVLEGTEMWKTHFNYKRSYLKLDAHYANLIVFDNFGMIEFDNPLNIIGDIGYNEYKFGHNYSGIYIHLSNILSSSIASVVPLLINAQLVLSDKIGYSEDDISASRLKITPQFLDMESFTFGGSQFKYISKLSEDLVQSHENYSYDVKYTKIISNSNWKDIMECNIMAEHSFYKNTNITSSIDAWMDGSNTFLGIYLKLPSALKLHANYLHSIFDITGSQSRHRYNIGFDYSYRKYKWNFESTIWQNDLNESLSWLDYYKYFEKYDGNGRWFQDFSEISFEKYTILGYNSGLLHTSNFNFSFNLKDKKFDFSLKNKFSQYDLFSSPKYVENVIVLKCYLSDNWIIKTDTRIPYYNDPFLDLHTNFSNGSNVFVSNYTEIAYYISTKSWISVGFGVNPYSMDVINDEFHNRGREEYLDSYGELPQYLESFYGGFGEKILNAERLLMDEKQISIKAFIKF
tara:strand:- start:1534 stop:3453 length:1920 start_codon:yes stop_codon:yes gene_type:complete